MFSGMPGQQESTLFHGCNSCLKLCSLLLTSIERGKSERSNFDYMILTDKIKSEITFVIRNFLKRPMLVMHACAQKPVMQCQISAEAIFVVTY